MSFNNGCTVIRDWVEDSGSLAQNAPFANATSTKKISNWKGKWFPSTNFRITDSVIHGSFFAGYVQLASQNLCRILAHVVANYRIHLCPLLSKTGMEWELFIKY